MSRIVFLDLESTSLRPDRRAWEIGVIVRDEGVDDIEHHFFIDDTDLDLGNADLASLRIGRFHERHPQARTDREASWTDTMDEEDTLIEVEVLTRGAVIVGVNPGFDCETLAARMRANGICPSWNYRLCDARTLAAGALRMPPPWDVEAILSAFGVSCPPELRHTASGDARLARDLFDAVLAEPPLATAVERWMELNPPPSAADVDEFSADDHCKRPHISVPPRTDEPLVDGLTESERASLAAAAERRAGGHVGIPIAGI